MVSRLFVPEDIRLEDDTEEDVPEEQRFCEGCGEPCNVNDLSPEGFCLGCEELM
jgi:hypothetical protein